MGFSLSAASNKRLIGVHPDLVRVVRRAIMLTEVDFAIIEGVRTLETQRKYLAAGTTQTLDSRHLTGHAVDLAAFEGNQVSNKIENYYEIAAAIKMASEQFGVAVRWGGAWALLAGSLSPKKLCENYKAERRALSRKPFIDAMHFELPKGVYP